MPESPQSAEHTFKLYLARDFALFVGLVSMVACPFFGFSDAGYVALMISLVIAQQLKKCFPESKPQFTSRQNLIRLLLFGIFCAGIVGISLAFALRRNSAGGWIGVAFAVVICAVLFVNAHRSIYIDRE
jgi:hypothetical protein